MIYISFVEFHSLMCHAKFQIHRYLGFGEEIVSTESPGSHPCHMTLIIYINIHSPIARSLLGGISALFLFDATAACVVPCGGPKKSPRTSSIVQFIFSF